MKKITCLISLIIILITSVSCEQSATPKMDGIWEFKKGTPEVYIINDSIPQELKDSLIANIKKHRESFEISYVYEIKNGKLNEGFWDKNEQKYFVENSYKRNCPFSIITSQTKPELINRLGIDTLYYLGCEGIGGYLQYINENQIKQYHIYPFDEEGDYSTLVVISDLKKFNDKGKIEYFKSQKLD